MPSASYSKKQQRLFLSRMSSRKKVLWLVICPLLAILFTFYCVPHKALFPQSPVAMAHSWDRELFFDHHKKRGRHHQEQSATSAPPVLSTQEYFVKSCNDGDTCRLIGTDGVVIRVRLAGIDAPEVAHHPGAPSQPVGIESKNFLNNEIQGKHIHIKAYGEDPYHRNIAELFLGDKNINVLMVEKGMAEVYQGQPPSHLDTVPYQQQLAKAQAEHTGIWSLGKDYESPKVWRQQHP